MIALSGCAKRNADRELARVVAFLDERVTHMVSAAEQYPPESSEANGFRVYAAALHFARTQLAEHRHRDAPPPPPDFEI